MPGKFHGLRSLTGDNPYGLKESDMTEQHTYTYTYLGRPRYENVEMRYREGGGICSYIPEVRIGIQRTDR